MVLTEREKIAILTISTADKASMPQSSCFSACAHTVLVHKRESM